MTPIFENIAELVAGVLKIPVVRLHPHTVLGRGVECDSLHHIEIMVAAEKKFGIRMTNKDFTEGHSLNDLLTVIQTKLPC